MAGWSFAPPGIFGLTGHQLGGPAPRLSSKKRPTVRAQKLQQQRRLEKSVRDEWIAPEPVIEEVENVTVEQGLQAPASPSSAKEEEEEQDLNDPQLLDWRRDPEKPVMRSSMGSNVSARARWQVAFAKVREMTSSVRKRQHRVALGLKVKEYLMFHHLRGSCGRLTRSVDSFERGLFSDKTEKMEITYEAFSEGVVPEAENWVRKNFEEMREVLEPVVYNEQNRKYDMNELERMLRMKEQEDAWLEAQQHSTDELLQTHGRLMERSVTSLAEMVRQVRQVLSALAAEIAAGLQRHRNLKTEYDSAEHESFDLSQKQKKMMTQIEEAEARQKEAKDGYNKEVETLTQEFTKVRRATTSVKFQLAKDNSYCDRLMQEIENAMAKKMAENAKVMAEEHIKRIKRKWDVHQREKIMRQATYEKELRELREKLAKRQAYLEERRVFLEVSLCRSKTTQAKLLLFELQARTQEMQNAAPAQRKTIKRLFSSSSLSSSQSIPKPQQGLLLLLGEELYLQRQWLTERGQYLEVDAKSFEIRGPPLLGTPTSLISKMWDVVNDYRDPSRSLQRIFREELMEAKTKERRGEELELMTAQLFDGKQVQQAVQKALTSLEATRRSQQSLAVRWAEVSSSVENTEVHDALTEKLEELDQGLNLAEASTRWFREPDQNTAQHLAGLTSQEELAWLGDLSRSLGSRCGQLRASAKVLEACQEGGKSGSMTAVERFLGDLPTVLNEDVLKSGQHFAARMKRLLAKRHALQDELLETWSRRMSVHEEQSHAECVSEGLGSLIYLLEDNELKETPQEDVTPAELLNILHSTAARVFKHRKSQVFDWAMMGLSDMDHMVAEAVTSEQARVPTDVQVAVSQLEVDSKDLLQDDRRNFDIHLLQQSVLESLEPPNDLLQSMEELAAAMDSSTIHVARGNVEELPAKPSESDEVSKPSPARPGSLPLEARGGLELPGISEADVVGHEVLDAEQPVGPDTTPSRPSTGRRPSSQLQPAGQTSETLIDQAPSDAKLHGVQSRETRELQIPAEGLSEAIGPSRDDPSRTAESARPSSSSNQPQHPTPGTSAVTVTQPLAEAVEDVATDVAPLRPQEAISSRSATVQEPEMGEEHPPREGEDFTQVLAELETPAVVSPKGDNVEVPASEVLSTNQSALADSDKSLSDVPVPSVTEGKLDQQAMMGLSDMDQVVAEALTSEVARVPTNVQVAESQLEDSKELLDDRPESLEPPNNLVQSMEEVPLPATDSGPTGLHVKESPAIPRESDEEATKPPASRRGSSPPAPIGSSLDLPGSLEADVVDEVLDVQVAGTDTTPSRSSTGIRPSSQLQPAGQTSVDLIDQAPSDPAKLDSVQSHVADARENHELQLQAEGMIEAFESRDRPGGPGVAESARLRPSSSTHQPQDLTPRTPGTSPTSAVTVTLPLAAEMDVAEEDIAEAVKNVATHFASMPVAPVTPVNGESLLPASSPTTTAPQTSVKALAAILSPKSATTTPKAKGRRRRPRAMTRLGKEFDASDEEADFPGDDRTPAEGDHVEVPIASEDASGSLHPQRVLQTNQSALADSEKSLSDVPVPPSVTEGKLNQQVHFWQMSSHTVATASHLSNTSNAREEDLEARENNKEKVAILSELGVNLGKHARSTTTPTSPHQRADSVNSVEAMRIKEAEGLISPNGSDAFPPISPKEGLARAQTDAIAGRRGRSLLAGDDDPMIERRRSSFDVIDTGVLVAIGRNTRELQKEDEEYVQEPSPAWMESIQSTEENLMKPQGRPSGHARHPELNVPSGTEQPMVSILSLEAEGHGASSKGRPRGLKGSMPRRGAPKFVRDKGKRSSGRPEENPLEWGATPVAATATVSIQEEPHEDAKDLEQQRPEVPGIDEAPAESEDVEMPIATNDAEVDEVLDERFEADRPSSAVSEEPQAVPMQEREDADHAVLARHPSKTAVGKLYRQASKGSKMDMLLHSRSFRSSTSLNLSEPDVGNDVEVDVEMDVDDVDVEAEAERKRETAARRWKLGGLAIQAVLRLRETIHSPNPPGSRRNSFNRSKILVQHQEAVLPNVPAVPGSTLPSPSSPSGTFSERGPPGPGSPSSTDAAAKPVASDVSETGSSRDVIVAPKLPQVPSQVPSQVVGREDVTALVRRTSITPRAALPAQGAMKQMQVTVPSIALSHATATTTAAAATAATPRLPPAPAPPKTAVRQNGLGDMTAKSSLDRGDNLTLTAATIQAVRSLDAPYLGGFGKSEQRLLSAHTQSTQLSHDDSHLTLSKDSAYSSAGFSPYTSQTELHKMSSTNLSYQSSVAKFSIDSREKDELKEENFENLDVTEATQESTTSALPLLDRRSYGVETALVTPTGKLLGSPGCWNGGLSKEVGEVYMAHAGHVLEMRSLPHVPGKFKKTAVKVTKAPTPKLVLTNLAKPKKKRQLIQATTPRAGGAKATGASREALRPKLYTRGHRLADRNVEVTEAS